MASVQKKLKVPVMEKQYFGSSLDTSLSPDAILTD